MSLRHFGTTALLCALIAPQAHAGDADTTGVVIGRLHDKSGHPFSWAVIRSIRDGRTTQADEAGNFRMGGLPPGPVFLAFDQVSAEPSVLTLNAFSAPSTIDVTLPERTARLDALRATKTVQKLFGAGG